MIASLADRYRIQREIGAGGMATVYLAHDLRHDRKWVAYEERSHGKPDIYLTDASGSGVRQKVSVDGGEQPRWTRGGRTYTYDVAPDGNRFLLVVPIQQMRAQPTVVVLNWFEELSGRMRLAR